LVVIVIGQNTNDFLENLGTKHSGSLALWRAARTNKDPRKLPPIGTDTTFVNAFPVVPEVKAIGVCNLVS
jgi:hypothetical protein